jgi:EAL domain-containing protein (putative c-di-GMP-specific phosphodiesterase class I)
LRSRFSNILTLLAAIVSFTPVLGVDVLLDAYVRHRETEQVRGAIEDVSASIRVGTQDAINGLHTILARSPSLCTPTFMDAVHAELGRSLYIRQVLVDNADDVQYCDALGSALVYSRLTAPQAIPGQAETLTIVTLGSSATPYLMLTNVVSSTRRISAFVPLVPGGSATLSRAQRPGGAVRIALADGEKLLTVGDAAALDASGPAGRYLTAQTLAGEMPIRVSAAVPFAVARADYAGLDVVFTVVACILSGAFLFLSLQYVRRTSLPAFDLERAIAAGELKPYYQPVIDLTTGRISGCEVLTRWEKRNGEIVPPGAFIDYAEQTGLAIPMTVRLMQQVRHDLAAVCAAHPTFKVSINLFEGHFRDSTIVEDVQVIFAGSPIGFRQLVFEITERHPLQNALQAQSVIAGLHALGARLAMDDAGTGHSNLAYMQTLGVDIIKIDRVFVDMVRPGVDHVPVLDGLIAMARDLRTEIVAEGVETLLQARYLRQRGVVHAQGFLFAPALRARSFLALCEAIDRPPGEAVPAAAAA